MASCQQNSPTIESNQSDSSGDLIKTDGNQQVQTKAFDHVQYIRDNTTIKEERDKGQPAYFVDYVIENLLEREEDVKYISSRTLLRKLNKEKCSQNYILINDTLSNGTICKIEIIGKDFSETEHQIRYRNENRKDYESIDGKFPYGGLYGGIHRELSTIKFSLNDLNIEIDQSLLPNVFEPIFCQQGLLNEGFEIYEDKGNIYIYVSGGNAADTYFGKLVFNSQGFVTSIMVDYVPLSMYGSFGRNFIGY